MRCRGDGLGGGNVLLTGSSSRPAGVWWVGFLMGGVIRQNRKGRKAGGVGAGRCTACRVPAGARVISGGVPNEPANAAGGSAG